VSGADDERWLRRAVELAERATKAVRPNPKVGCVLVQHGTVAGEGWHERAGGPHAEVIALRAAGDRARGSTAYVTLEPCAHFGRTPPCTQALIDAGVVRVVAGCRDPNPLAQGGAEVLRAAGIAAEVGLLADECARPAEVFLCNVRHQRPFVRLKLAATLDGYAAANDGSSRWITGPEARAVGHQLRDAADAVLVGSGTVLADDPRLDVRDVAVTGPLPVRVVLDRRLRVRPHHAVCDTARQSTWIVTERGTEGDDVAALRDCGVEVLSVAARDDWLGAVCKVLFERGICAALCEGGPTLAAALLQQGLVDRLDWFTAPALLGSGRGAVGDLGIPSIGGALRWRVDGVERVGGDVHVVLAPIDTAPVYT
jgi:diaminohydroxyphosphoribosylaminopyrimidine deaminase/5-amino-6-(5-phosphoribosylamino)uracil reductase